MNRFKSQTRFESGSEVKRQQKIQHIKPPCRPISPITLVYAAFKIEEYCTYGTKAPQYKKHQH
jgi:hypothetical protein